MRRASGRRPKPRTLKVFLCGEIGSEKDTIVVDAATGGTLEGVISVHTYDRDGVIVAEVTISTTNVVLPTSVSDSK